ncbi:MULTISPECIES: AAA family ATPase [Bacillus amyloliquefaciens group]|uniref:AAA family ATPase n=1 Tax=Bacillus amyloliquefaciens group TaxID=1938374 RepID=UPI0010A41519|nr:MULTISPECIES: AAA family ATPase [Bacillus amyloliquefaciens group]QCC34934.1 ATP-binding protein [Bacillus velezensis]
MIFKVKEVGFFPSNDTSDVAYLIKDNWNDWWDYKTLFELVYVDDNYNIHNIGSLKIGEFGLERIDDKAAVSPNVPDSFSNLDTNFFSLGQDVNYYNKLNELGENIRYKILVALRDVALNEELFEKALHETVMGKSLLRSITRTSVRGQFRRLANGDASLTKYKFKYTVVKDGMDAPLELTFHVSPKSNPPTNLHVLIGKNGVGKTHILNNMIKSLIQSKDDQQKQDFGHFSSEIEDNDDEDIFANLVSVSFSAFDHTKPLPERDNNSTGMKYSYVGLQHTKDKKKSGLKTVKELGLEFKKSLKEIMNGAKATRWSKAVKTLETDPLFRDTGIFEAVENEKYGLSTVLFNKLSSGHKIVLLTITKLVEKVEEKTLVLLDEPEGHLHPPLLSAFTRALSDLLKYRNGVAIIATHSPVILQEVPKNCVWVLNRINSQIKSDRPEIETFGENVGILTREVFGLEVTHSGFHKILTKVVEELRDFEDTIDYFNNELGMEAKAIIRALLINQDSEEEL